MSRNPWPGEGNINTDPYFADPENSDYHLKSQVGRWNPTSQVWVIDQISSPCIDAGDPSTPVGLERFPNGGRINMGAYGSTPEASLSPSGLHAEYGGGTGEPSDPYLIYSAEQMDEIGLNEEDWDKHFKLMSNIDLSGFYYETALIARDTDTAQNNFRGTPFTGTFDGNGHTISHLTIEGGGFLGLFGRLESGAEVRNLGVVDVNVICSGDHAGGLVADNNNCLVTNCYSTGTVTGRWRVGGLVGYSRGEVSHCYSTCTVRGYGDVGGLVGSIHWGSVAYSYSIGSVSADSYVGGFLGETVGEVIACFWDVETSGLSNMCGSVGRDSVGCDDNNGKSTAEMQRASTFLEAGWDFVNETENGTEDIWKITEGLSYPQLWWEVSYEPPSEPEPEPEPEWVVIELTEATFDEIVLLSDLPVLVDFWAPWCGPCLMMAPVIEEIAEEFAGRLKVGKLNTDYSPSINDRYDITAIPTIILFKGGQIQKIWIGVTSKEDIIAEFDFSESETDDIQAISVRASNPYPADGAENVKRDVTLSWTPGLNAVSHDVYFGFNRDDIVNADTSDTTGTYRGRNPNANYIPPDSLIYSGTYYWRIDEVNEVNPNSPRKGNVWRFTTANFIVVDDFESYDAGDNQIWYSWHDGLGFGVPVAGQPFYPGNGTGSAVGFEFEWPEQTIVHSGQQSMPYEYNNNRPNRLKYSEANLTLSYPRNWTVDGVSELSLWFRGNRDNDCEPMYVAVANAAGPTAVAKYDNPNAAQVETWTEWKIDLKLFADQGVDLTDVDMLSIGFGDRNNPQPGGLGKMWFDDIRLYQPRPAASNDLEVKVP
jgi:thioredoxin